jgi:anti-anti-sigma factor
MRGAVIESQTGAQRIAISGDDARAVPPEPRAEEMPMTATAVRAAARSGLDAGTDQVTIRLSDELLADGLADVRWLLHDALLAGARELVVDLHGVQHLSSPAVASFLSAHRTCRARGGTVVLRGANRRTLDLLHRTGLWRVLELESDRRAA